MFENVRCHFGNICRSINRICKTGAARFYLFNICLGLSKAKSRLSIQQLSSQAIKLASVGAVVFVQTAIAKPSIGTSGEGKTESVGAEINIPHVSINEFSGYPTITLPSVSGANVVITPTYLPPIRDRGKRNLANRDSFLQPKTPNDAGLGWSINMGYIVAKRGFAFDGEIVDGRTFGEASPEMVTYYDPSGNMTIFHRDQINQDTVEIPTTILRDFRAEVGSTLSCGEPTTTIFPVGLPGEETIQLTIKECQEIESPFVFLDGQSGDIRSVQFGGDYCDPSGLSCKNLVSDINFIDSQNRRITRKRGGDGHGKISGRGFSYEDYHMLLPDGSKMIFEPVERANPSSSTFRGTNRSTEESNKKVVEVYFFPTKIIRADGVEITISYGGFSNDTGTFNPAVNYDSDGTLPGYELVDNSQTSSYSGLPKISKIRSNRGGEINFDYHSDRTLTRAWLTDQKRDLFSLSYETFGETNRLSSYTDAIGNVYSIGYQSEVLFETAQSTPWINRLTLPSNESININYRTLDVRELSIDTKNGCSGNEANKCPGPWGGLNGLYDVEGTDFFRTVRVDDVSYAGGLYKFDYVQYWPTAEDLDSHVGPIYEGGARGNSDYNLLSAIEHNMALGNIPGEECSNGNGCWNEIRMGSSYSWNPFTVYVRELNGSGFVSKTVYYTGTLNPAKYFGREFVGHLKGKPRLRTRTVPTMVESPSGEMIASNIRESWTYADLGDVLEIGASAITGVANFIPTHWHSTQLNNGPWRTTSTEYGVFDYSSDSAVGYRPMFGRFDDYGFSPRRIVTFINSQADSSIGDDQILQWGIQRGYENTDEPIGSLVTEYTYFNERNILHSDKNKKSWDKDATQGEYYLGVPASTTKYIREYDGLKLLSRSEFDYSESILNSLLLPNKVSVAKSGSISKKGDEISVSVSGWSVTNYSYNYTPGSDFGLLEYATQGSGDELVKTNYSNYQYGVAKTISIEGIPEADITINQVYMNGTLDWTSQYGVKTSFGYDNLGRVIRETVGENKEPITTVTIYPLVNCQTDCSVVVYSEDINGEQSGKVITVLDSWGREVVTSRLIQNDEFEVNNVREVNYDILGRVSSIAESGPNSTVLREVFTEFDILGRSLLKQTFDSESIKPIKIIETSFAWNGVNNVAKETLSDAGVNNYSKVTESDFLGRVVKTEQLENGLDTLNYVRYSYDLALDSGYTTQSTIPLGDESKTRKVISNLIGQTLFESHPEFKSNLPEQLGDISYKYDTRGNLVSIEGPTRDGSTYTHILEYDKFNRVVKKCLNDCISGNVLFEKEYDDNIGALTRSVTNSGVVNNISVFDSLNRPKTFEQSIPNIADGPTILTGSSSRLSNFSDSKVVLNSASDELFVEWSSNANEAKFELIWQDLETDVEASHYVTTTSDSCQVEGDTQTCRFRIDPENIQGGMHLLKVRGVSSDFEPTQWSQATINISGYPILVLDADPSVLNASASRGLSGALEMTISNEGVPESILEITQVELLDAPTFITLAAEGIPSPDDPIVLAGGDSPHQLNLEYEVPTDLSSGEHHFSYKVAVTNSYGNLRILDLNFTVTDLKPAYLVQLEDSPSRSLHINQGQHTGHLGYSLISFSQTEADVYYRYFFQAPGGQPVPVEMNSSTSFNESHNYGVAVGTSPTHIEIPYLIEENAANGKYILGVYVVTRESFGEPTNEPEMSSLGSASAQLYIEKTEELIPRLEARIVEGPRQFSVGQEEISGEVKIVLKNIGTKELKISRMQSTSLYQILGRSGYQETELSEVIQNTLNESDIVIGPNGEEADYSISYTIPDEPTVVEGTSYRYPLGKHIGGHSVSISIESDDSGEQSQDTIEFQIDVLPKQTQVEIVGDQIQTAELLYGESITHTIEFHNRGTDPVHWIDLLPDSSYSQLFERFTDNEGQITQRNPGDTSIIFDSNIVDFSIHPLDPEVPDFKCAPANALEPNIPCGLSITFTAPSPGQLDDPDKYVGTYSMDYGFKFPTWVSAEFDEIESGAFSQFLVSRLVVDVSRPFANVELTEYGSDEKLVRVRWDDYIFNGDEVVKKLQIKNTSGRLFQGKIVVSEENFYIPGTTNRFSLEDGETHTFSLYALGKDQGSVISNIKLVPTVDRGFLQEIKIPVYFFGSGQLAYSVEGSQEFNEVAHGETTYLPVTISNFNEPAPNNPISGRRLQAWGFGDFKDVQLGNRPCDNLQCRHIPGQTHTYQLMLKDVSYGNLVGMIQFGYKNEGRKIVVAERSYTGKGLVGDRPIFIKLDDYQPEYRYMLEDIRENPGPYEGEIPHWILNTSYRMLNPAIKNQISKPTKIFFGKTNEFKLGEFGETRSITTRLSGQFWFKDPVTQQLVQELNVNFSRDSESEGQYLEIFFKPYYDSTSTRYRPGYLQVVDAQNPSSVPNDLNIASKMGETSGFVGPENTPDGTDGYLDIVTRPNIFQCCITITVDASISPVNLNVDNAVEIVLSTREGAFRIVESSVQINDGNAGSFWKVSDNRYRFDMPTMGWFTFDVEAKGPISTSHEGYTATISAYKVYVDENGNEELILLSEEPYDYRSYQRLRVRSR